MNTINKKMNSIKNSLIRKITVNKSEKSSHWINFTKNIKISDNDYTVSGIQGFGGNSKRTFFSSLYHKFCQRLFLNKIGKYSKFEAFNHARIISYKQMRNLDLDLLRHVFTFELLKQKVFTYLLPQSLKVNCCVIGDGQSNFVSLALFNSGIDKIISVNLPEVLLNDLTLLQKLRPNQDEYVLVETKKDLNTALNSKNVKIIFVSANDSSILFKANIFLFVNIASMQEMKLASISEYFNIIKSNKAYFYCCNRDEKILSGGEKILFGKYPWGKYKLLLEGLPQWHQFYYKLSFQNFKIKHLYNGVHKHKLVKYN